MPFGLLVLSDGLKTLRTLIKVTTRSLTPAMTPRVDQTRARPQILANLLFNSII